MMTPEQIDRLLLSIERLVSVAERITEPKHPNGVTSLEELGLSVRAMNCLESANIRTVEELTSKSSAYLLNTIRSFGRTTLREVERKLNARGLSLCE